MQVQVRFLKPGDVVRIYGGLHTVKSVAIRDDQQCSVQYTDIPYPIVSNKLITVEVVK